MKRLAVPVLLLAFLVVGVVMGITNHPPYVGVDLHQLQPTGSVEAEVLLDGGAGGE